MSGVLAVFHRNERPVDAALLERLTHTMTYRAPDGTECWREGPIGLGQALFRTNTPGEQRHAEIETSASHGSLSGLRIVADARIDQREELVEELRPSHPGLTALSPVHELLAAAYERWGEACAEHLLGDYAFIVWDTKRKTLFAARDPFGVKPLYVAESAGAWIVGNTIPTLLQHPDVSLELDERAIGDYLLFGYIYDETATYFAEVRALARGTSVTLTPERRRDRPFWAVPDIAEIRYRRRQEYVDHFEALLKDAVADRLCESRTVVELSGGLDSAAVAACAAGLARRSSLKTEIRAVTAGYERLFDDSEPRLAQISAEGLGIPSTFLGPPR